MGSSYLVEPLFTTDYNVMEGMDRNHLSGLGEGVWAGAGTP
jgi:hypothetical protein